MFMQHFYLALDRYKCAINRRISKTLKIIGGRNLVIMDKVLFFLYSFIVMVH